MSKQRGFRAIVLTFLALALLAPLAAQSPDVDGFVRNPVTGVVEAPYVVQGITYTQDQATGDFTGFLYTAEDGVNHYFAFEQSVHINDNTYEQNAIGWGDRRQGHRLQDLINSEHAQIRLYNGNGELVLDFFLDYATQSKQTNQEMLNLGATGGDGRMIFGDPTLITGSSSSLVWNFNLASPNFPDKQQTNPQRVPVNTYDSGTTADSNFPWVYELVYEFSVASAAFGPSGFGGIEILEVHNSPLKDGADNPVPIPVLTVSKVADPPSGSQVLDGQQILYTINFSNTGLAPLTDVVITDTLDPNLTLIDAFGGTYDDSTRTITWGPIAFLGAGESGSVSFLAEVDPISPEEDQIFNFGTITANELPTPVDTNTTVHIIIPSPDLSLDKTCPIDMITGTQATYSLTVSNIGQALAENVVLTDTLPDGVTFVDSTVPATQSGQDLTFDLGTLAAGDSVTITIFVTVDATGGTLTNTASVSTSTPEGGEGTSNNSDSCSSDVLAPDIAVDKTCPVDMVAGQQTSYSVTVSNLGTATANDVVLTDVLPAGVSFVSSDQAPDSQAGQTLTYNVGDLAPGASTTIEITVSVDVTSGVLTNTVSATTSSVEGGEGSANNSDSCESTVTAPDISVDKTCPVDMISGSQATYSVVVSNLGSATATNVVLTDVLPGEVSFVSATPAPSSVSGNTLTFDLGDIAAGDSVTIGIEVNVDATSGAALNTASATTDSVEGGLGTANNSDECSSLITSADIAVITDCPVDMVAGEQASYTVTVSNLGDSTATNVVLTDTLPVGVSLVSSSPAADSVAGQILTYNLGDLAPGASVTITINVDVEATSGSLTNSASATTDSTEGGAGASNNSDSCSSDVLSADIAVAKSCPVDMVAGQAASYGISVSNLGNTTAENVVLTDTLPLGVSFVSASPAETSVSGQVVTFNLGDIAAGDSVTVTIEVTVTATSGTLTNTVSAATDSVEGGDGAANNSAECSSTVLAADVTISKSCVPDSVVANGALSFVITFSNEGTAAADAVVVTDTVPSDLFEGNAFTASAGVVSGLSVTLDVGSLAPGGSGSLTISGAVRASSAAAGDYLNSAAITTSSLQDDTADDASSCTVTVQAPNLSLSKTSVVSQNPTTVSNSATVSAAEIVETASDSVSDGAVQSTEITYTLTVTNSGNAAATNVEVVDTLPGGVTVIANPDGGTVSGGSVSWTIASVPAGGTASVSITVRVNQ